MPSNSQGSPFPQDAAIQRQLAIFQSGTRLTIILVDPFDRERKNLFRITVLGGLSLVSAHSYFTNEVLLFTLFQRIGYQVYVIRFFPDDHQDMLPRTGLITILVDPSDDRRAVGTIAVDIPLYHFF